MVRSISELVESRLYPRKLHFDKGKVLLELSKLNKDQLDAGFYLQVLPEVDESDLVFVDLDSLDFDVKPMHQPAGFIFHLGRCGSTVTVNMLNSLDRYQVISETTLFHTLAKAQLYRPISDESTRRKNLMDLFCLLGEAENKRTIFKMSSWEVRMWDEYTQLYPDVRSCLIVRKMLEIMVSLLQSPPGRFHRNRIRKAFKKELSEGKNDLQQFFNQLYGPEMDYLAECDFVDFIGSALKYMLSDIAAYTGEYLIIDHEDVLKRVPGDLCEYFGIAPDAQQIQEMEHCAGYNAKSKTQNEKYIDDSARKAVEATPETRRWCENTLQPLLDKIISNNFK